VPTTVPSTLTFTLEIAVPTPLLLSSAQPDTVAVPDNTAFAAGPSRYTLGGPDSADDTVRVAVLLAAPAVVVCVVVTPEVVLGWAPGELLVTLKITVQLPLAGIVIPLKLRAVAPAVRDDGAVPLQVPVTAPPTALIFTSVSVNAPPVRLDALLFDNVNVTTDVPPI
jgi:hypothetical protein